MSGKKLGRPTQHRLLMLRGMVTNLVLNETLKTTEAKAFEARRMTEKVITLGKEGHAPSPGARRPRCWRPTRRRSARCLLSSQSATRTGTGGYTRSYKLGKRKGDAADMALVELVG